MLDPEPSLYRRLGGYDTIAAIIDDLLSRMLADPRVNHYWRGKSRINLQRERQIFVEHLCAAAGGPVYYTGRAMRTAHLGLGITGEEWAVFMNHLEDTLNNIPTGPPERTEVLAAAAALRDEVVELPDGTAGQQP